MKIADRRSAATNETGVYVSVHFQPSTLVHASVDEDGSVVVKTPGANLFFHKDTAREMSNLLIHYTEGGIEITAQEALWLYDAVSDSQTFSKRHPTLVEALRIAGGVAAE